MRMTKDEILQMGITQNQLDYLFGLNEHSKEYRNTSKHKDVLLFEVKMKINKYKETFYVNAIQVGMRTVDIIVYNNYEQALKEIDSIIEETIQGSLF